MAQKGLVLSGARAILSIEGVKVFYCTNVSYGEEITREPIEPLDQFDVAEHVATAYRVNFSSQHVRVIKNAIKNRDGVALFPRLENILTAGVMTATVHDRPTGLIIANIENVEATRYNINVGARGIVLTDSDFVATRIRDESEVESIG